MKVSGLAVTSLFLQQAEGRIRKAKVVLIAQSVKVEFTGYLITHLTQEHGFLEEKKEGTLIFTDVTDLHRSLNSLNSFIIN